MNATATKYVQLLTSAPEVYDGFGTATVAVLGVDTFSKHPVRAVSVDTQHYGWQVTRYQSGNHRHTDARVNVATYLKFGDWRLSLDHVKGARVTFHGEGGAVDNLADDGTVCVKLDNGGAVLAHLDTGLIAFERPAAKTEEDDA